MAENIRIVIVRMYIYIYIHMDIYIYIWIYIYTCIYGYIMNCPAFRIHGTIVYFPI